MEPDTWRGDKNFPRLNAYFQNERYVSENQWVEVKVIKVKSEGWWSEGIWVADMNSKVKWIEELIG
jgi:hypothetical protein